MASKMFCTSTVRFFIYTRSGVKLKIYKKEEKKSMRVTISSQGFILENNLTLATPIFDGNEE